MTELRTLEISTVTQTKRRREKEERANGEESVKFSVKKTRKGKKKSKKEELLRCENK